MAACYIHCMDFEEILALKKFNVNGICYPDKHYMADIQDRLLKMEELVDEGDYFVINRARQYGKTTTLWALKNHLREKYLVVSISFQQLSDMDYKNENAFACAFADLFLDSFEEAGPSFGVDEELAYLRTAADGIQQNIGLRRLFRVFGRLCANAPKKIILLIDEVDQASDQQVFLDFLAQLRAYYLSGNRKKTFWSVILAGVYEIQNLKLRMRPQMEHQYNSPWNIAVDFDIDLRLYASDIAGMLTQYEQEHHTGMEVNLIAGLLYDYTSGYPFLVSRLCKILAEQLLGKAGFADQKNVWTGAGVTEAVKILLTEPNTLFDDMVKKLNDFKELRVMLYAILFRGERISYNIDLPEIRIGHMFGFLENADGIAVVSNRIFETRMYNLFLSEEIVNSAIYQAADRDKNHFVKDGYLDMELVLERFIEAFTDIYSGADGTFLEENGRRFFLLYLKPIINGIGNYYIEARTRDLRRTDVVIDYCGKQYVCEMKIWRGGEYHKRGEQQLIRYLEDYHLTTGYLLSFNFNKNKEVGVWKYQIGNITIVEAVV